MAEELLDFPQILPNGFGAALALIKVLTGASILPRSLAIPANYLTLLALAAVAATAAAVFGMFRHLRD